MNRLLSNKGLSDASRGSNGVRSVSTLGIDHKALRVQLVSEVKVFKLKFSPGSL